MSSRSAFRDYVVQDLLVGVDGISSRGMFGGFGLYRHGRIFGFIFEDAFYVKLPRDAADALIRVGGEPFRYTNPKGKVVTMPYTKVPESILENREQCREWVEQATG